jgi:hypothetical protein
VLLAIGGCTVGACFAAPHIGWTGWAVIVGLYMFARHLEQQREMLFEIQRQREQPRDDRYSWPPDA